MKVLIVGFGSIGRRHLNNLNKLGFKGELFCFRRKMEQIEGFPHVRILTTPLQVFDIRPDVMFICNPSHLHAKWINIAADLNCHTFVEKPVVTSISALDSLRKLRSSFAERVFFVGYMMRYHKGILALKKMLDDKLIGSVYHARVEFGGYLPSWPYVDYKESYAARLDMGGGVILTISHEVDLVEYLFGESHELTAIKSRTKLLDISAEEMAEIIFNYEDKQVSLHLDYLQKDYRRNIRVLGDEGSLTWDWNRSTITLKKIGELENEIFQIADFDVNDLYLDEVADFLDLIEKNRYTHALDFDFALHNTSTLLQTL